MVQCDFQCRVLQRDIYSSCCDVLQKRLHLKMHKLSIVQHFTDADRVVRKEFCMQIFHRIQDYERFLNSVIISYESSFHVSGHNCRIWGNENPRVSVLGIKKDAFTSSKMAHPLITLENCASTSIPVSQVAGLVELRRWHGHLVPRILHPWIFSYRNSLKIECACKCR
jgi:hypothetical protein